MIPRLMLALACTIPVCALATPAPADDAPKPTVDAPAQPPVDDGTKFFTSLDKNKDGKLELDEIPEQARPRLAPLFRRLGKASITAAEFAKVRGEEGAGEAADDKARFFDLLDANKDGKLTHTETPEQAKKLVAALLERAGKPADGFLTKAEYVAVVSGKTVSGADTPKTKSPGLVGLLDANGDGKLNKAELTQAAAKFDELDVDGDGSLDSRELLGSGNDSENPATGGTEYAQRVFRELDANGDGRISLEEAPELVKEAFDQLDLDEDGLSFEEFSKAIEKKAEASDKDADEATESGNATSAG